MDIMTKSGNFWNDDVQVVALYAYKRYAVKTPIETAGSHVYLYEVLENEA
jgi:Holliday junction resolvase RusA-like endonuclease